MTEKNSNIIPQVPSDDLQQNNNDISGAVLTDWTVHIMQPENWVTLILAIEFTAVILYTMFGEL